jgi:hypothetical protein
MDIPGVIVYIDDIIIASKTMEEHERSVKEVLQRLSDGKMRINKDKCMFGRSEVDYLGFKMSKSGIRVDPNRTTRLMEMAVPSNGKELLSFLCMANYIRQHIPEFGLVTAPLYEISSRLGRKKLCQDEKWLVEGLPAWEKLQRIIASPMVLQYPNPKLPFILRTDACTTGYGGYLFQVDEDGSENIVHTFSGTFKKAQMAYSIPKKELYAIIYAFRHLAFFLRGAKFLLQTDAMCLTELHFKQIDCETMAKWAMVLSEFDYEIQHIPGTLNVFANLLSRQNEDCTMDTWRKLKGSYYEERYAAGVTNERRMGMNVIKLKKRILKNNANENYPKDIKEKLKLLSTRKTNKTMTGRKLPFNADTFTNDWKLNPDFFNVAEKKWGPHSIDLFAASHNAQTDRYVTQEMNAFSVKWKGENAWANPPWHLIGRVLQRIKIEKCTLTICVPYYTKATWWSVLTDMTVDTPILVGKNDNVFLRRGTEQVGCTPWEVTLIVRVSGHNDRSHKVNLDRFIGDWITSGKRLGDANQLSLAAMKLVERTRLQVVAAEIDHSAATGEEINEPLFAPPQKKGGKNVSDGQLVAVTTRSRVKLTHPSEVGNQAQSDDEAGVLMRSGTEGPIFSTDEGMDTQYTPVAIEQGANAMSWAHKYDIVAKYHCLGHQQVDTVINMVSSTGGYDWPELRELATQVDYNCNRCELKRVEKKGFHPLRSLKSRFAGDVWIIDLIQLPKKYDVNDQAMFVLHVLDHWSGYSWLRALPNKEAKTIAHHLTMIMMDNGCPREFRHDGGAEFKKETTTAIELLAASHRVIGIPYHAQSQGANERKHGDLKDIIIELLDEEVGNRDWKQVLPFAQMKLNLQESRKHGSTPFAIYFGRTHNIFNVNEKHGTAKEWIDAVRTYDELIIPALNEKIDTYHEQQEEAFLLAHEAEIREYELNELVKVRVNGENGQGPNDTLAYKWKGPFRILAKIKGGYNIGYVHPRDGQESTILNEHTVPPEQLSPWRRALKVENYTEEWLAIKVLDHKMVGPNGDRFYKVKWEGNWRPTWEAAHNVSWSLKDNYWKTYPNNGTNKKGINELPEESVEWPEGELPDAKVAKHRFQRLTSKEPIVFRNLLSDRYEGINEVHEVMQNKRPKKKKRRVSAISTAKNMFGLKLREKARHTRFWAMHRPKVRK